MVSRRSIDARAAGGFACCIELLPLGDHMACADVKGAGIGKYLKHSEATGSMED